jgi:hypothetical protein
MQFAAGQEIYTGENFTGVAKKLVWGLKMLCHWFAVSHSQKERCALQFKGQPI